MPLHRRRKPAVGNWQQSTLKGPVHIWTIPDDVFDSADINRKNYYLACTLVTLMLAKILNQKSSHLPSADDLSQATSLLLEDEMQFILGVAMIKANREHWKAMKKRKPTDITRVFTIPQGIEIIRGIHEIDFTSVRNGRKLADYMSTVVKSHLLAGFSQIFIVLVMGRRAVLVVYDREKETIAAVDGFAFRQDGVMIIASPVDQLDLFCLAVLSNMHPDQIGDKGFEISVIQVVESSEAKPAVKEKIFPRLKKDNCVIL